MTVDYAAALIDENLQLSELLFAADLSLAVPTCPGWSLLQLMRHVGRGDRWAAQIISDEADGDLDPRLVRDGRPPEDVAGARVWLEASPHTVIDAVAQCGEDSLRSTFLGPRPAGWWIRRRLHEATVHRADVAMAIEGTYELSADLAADGIEEWLDRLVVELATTDSSALPPGRAVALEATDLSEGWLISGVGPGIAWRRTTALESADVRVVGGATDLFLAIVRRRAADEDGTEGIRLDGNAGVWRTWLGGTPL